MACRHDQQRHPPLGCDVWRADVMNRSVIRPGAIVHAVGNSGAQSISRGRVESNHILRRPAFTAKRNTQIELRLGLERRKSENIQLKTNRHGLFNWDRWDGKPWVAEETVYYTFQGSTHQANRMRPILLATRKKLNDNEHPFELVRFLVAYYSGQLDACRRLELFARLLTDLTITTFLMKTAPLWARENAMQTLTQLEINDFVLSQYYKALANIERNKVAAKHCPLYFQAQVQRSLCKKPRQISRLAARSRMKMERQQAKTQLDWESVKSLMENPGHGRVMETTAMREYFDTWPSSWVVQGFYSQMLTLLARAKSRAFELSTWGRLRVDDSMSEREMQFRKVFNIRCFPLRAGLVATTLDLYDLSEDLAVLRYFRVERFPDLVMAEEIHRGRELYDALQDTSSMSPMSWTTKRDKPTSLDIPATAQVDHPEQQIPIAMETPSRSKVTPVFAIHVPKHLPSPRSKKYVSPTEPKPPSQPRHKPQPSQPRSRITSHIRVRSDEHGHASLRLF
ncbi:hypothetical protein P153DRAFT_357267 [Dothidotthia symphoricarpi CBS 119687]|uniref:Uncharacterized protein n=1 Tax=Dothidotthia symphoricarpi CBS 119687 TaxID=1392245 RepID=A0A6A6A9Y8_9PLEO|nr:uncharacterized protein P153DRAFT_357267 [Dothidotthia symphoricarpi CBS 119687]KAF2128742.1 hypothetical protein P153DRAFT_357267 [Dothidotthia symphoricarpi CBS 119687]